MLVFIFLTFWGQNALDVVDLFLHAFQNSIKNLRAKTQSMLLRFDNLFLLVLNSYYCARNLAKESTRFLPKYVQSSYAFTPLIAEPKTGEGSWNLRQEVNWNNFKSCTNLLKRYPLLRQLWFEIKGFNIHSEVFLCAVLTHIRTGLSPRRWKLPCS